MAKAKVKQIINVNKENTKEFNLLCKKLSQINVTEKELKASSTEVKDALKSMCSQDARYESNAWSLGVTFVDETVNLDTTRLKAEQPELYATLLKEYSRVTSAHLKVSTPVKKSGIDIGL